FSQLAKAADLLGGAAGWADQEVSRMYGLFHDAALNDPHRQCLPIGSSTISPCGPQAFEQGVRDMRAFIWTRAAFVKKWLAQQRYQPPTGVPVIDSVTSDSGIATLRGVGFGENMDSIGASPPRSIGRSFVAVEGVRVPIRSMSPYEALVEIPPDLQAGS